MDGKAVFAALVQIADGIEEAVGAAGKDGAPSGVIYSALLGIMSLRTYNLIIDLMIANKRLRKVGHLLYLGEKAKVQYQEA